MSQLYAFTGFARSGKDLAAAALIERGWKRANFGDHIKARLKGATQPDLVSTLVWVLENESFHPSVINGVIDGFAAVRRGVDPFTEDDADKVKIRTALERLGECFYDDLLEAYFADLPDMAVNTRIVRAKEAEAWVARGGKIYEVFRPAAAPASQWEADRLTELRETGLISGTLGNIGDAEYLHKQVREKCLGVAA